MGGDKDTASTWQSLRPEDITAQGHSMEFLVLTQMNRINWLLSVLSSQRYDWKEQVALLRATKNSLRCLETMLKAYSTELEWVDFAAEIKINMKRKYKVAVKGTQKIIGLGLLELKFDGGEEQKVDNGLDIYNDLLCDWYDKVVMHLSKTPLLPLEKRQWDLDEGLIDVPA